MSAHDMQTAQQAGASIPAIRMVRGDAVKMEPVAWLWVGYIPGGMLSIIGGAPGTGKTTLALSLAAIVTLRGCWPDGSRSDEAGDVVIWSGEDGQSVLAARLAAMGADLERVHFIEGVSTSDDAAFDPGRDMPLLEDAMARLAAPRLLIIDPIMSAVTGDPHKGSEVRRSLQPVVTLAQRIGCAVVGITHFSKGTAGNDPTERITGSIAFAALARVVLVAAKVKAVAEDGEQRRVFVRAKSNIGPDDGGFSYTLDRVEVAPGVAGQRVIWLNALEGSALEVLEQAEASDKDADTAADVEEFIRDALRDGSPTPSNSIQRDAKEAGFAWRTVQRRAKKMGVLIRKDGMKGGWTWTLRPGSNPENGSQTRMATEDAEDAEDANFPGCRPVASSGASSSEAPVAPDDVEVF